MKVSIIIFAVCVIYTFGCNKKSMDESSLELEHYGVYVIQKESSELKGFNMKECMIIFLVLMSIQFQQLPIRKENKNCNFLKSR